MTQKDVKKISAKLRNVPSVHYRSLSGRITKPLPQNYFRHANSRGVRDKLKMDINTGLVAKEGFGMISPAGMEGFNLDLGLDTSEDYKYKSKCNQCE